MRLFSQKIQPRSENFPLGCGALIPLYYANRFNGPSGLGLVGPGHNDLSWPLFNLSTTTSNSAVSTIFILSKIQLKLPLQSVQRKTNKKSRDADLNTEIMTGMYPSLSSTAREKRRQEAISLVFYHTLF